MVRVFVFYALYIHFFHHASLIPTSGNGGGDGKNVGGKKNGEIFVAKRFFCAIGHSHPKSEFILRFSPHDDGYAAHKNLY